MAICLHFDVVGVALAVITSLGGGILGATFATDATVVDEGNTYTGSERIGWWLEHAASEFTFTRTLLSVEDPGDGDHVVRNHLAGNFPGGEADLNYRFRLRDGLIEHLEIAL
jgi:hypothetical protein